ADRRACASSHAIECQVAWHSQRSGHPASSRAPAIAYARASEPRASLLTARARRARASDDVVRWAWKSSRATTAVMARRWALVARRVSEVGTQAAVARGASDVRVCASHNVDFESGSHHTRKVVILTWLPRRRLRRRRARRRRPRRRRSDPVLWTWHVL